MNKVGRVVLSIALATTLAACSSRTEQNQAASQNVNPAPAEPATNASASENVAVTNTMTNAAQAVESTRPAEPRRTPPAPKAAPAPRPAPQDDPHAGHDMSAMNHQ
jgi:PBP1b-binding outer membrane lipoprotein LpoB